MYPGEMRYKIYEILSLATGTPVVLYEKYSQDDTKVSKPGHQNPDDTLSLWTEHTLTDLDNDHILEMVEITKCVKIVEQTAHENLKLSTKIDTAVVKFNDHVRL